MKARIFMAIVLLMAVTFQAQTFTVLHTFSGGADGSYPYAGPTLDVANNLYGTVNGGVHSDGVVYKITNAGILSALYSFSGSDGKGLATRILLRSGVLYGSTAQGDAHNRGGVFNLHISPTICRSINCPW